MVVGRLLFALSCCLVSVMCGNAPIDAEFAMWLQKHSRTYPSRAELMRRNKIFTENLNAIAAMNEKYQGKTLFAPNEFADLTSDEFRQQRLMTARKPADLSFNMAPETALADLPTAFDWRTQGAVTYVHDQGSVGTCWAESTIGNIEGQWFLAGHNLTALSVEQVVECDDEKDPSKDRADCGVFGGWPYLAYQYVIAQGGLESDAAIPYCVGGGNKTVEPCYPCVPSGWNSTLCGPAPTYCNHTYPSCNVNPSNFVARISSWTAISEDETTIQNELYKRGPLSICLNASELQFYHRGVWNPHFCNKAELDHCVLLVGWGQERTMLGKIVPYWIVKNSWGTSWGQEGYFWIERGEGTCGMNTQVTSAIV